MNLGQVTPQQVIPCLRRNDGDNAITSLSDPVISDDIMATILSNRSESLDGKNGFEASQPAVSHLTWYFLILSRNSGPSEGRAACSPGSTVL